MHAIRALEYVTFVTIDPADRARGIVETPLPASAKSAFALLPRARAAVSSAAADAPPAEFAHICSNFVRAAPR
jgi:hypothetical protein